MAEAGIGIAKKGNFTLIAVNPASEMGTLFVSDDYEAPARGNARLRLLHVAPGAGTVDVYITAPGASIAGIEPTVADLAYLGSSGYLEAPAATYQLRICPAGTKTVAIDSGPRMRSVSHSSRSTSARHHLSSACAQSGKSVSNLWPL